MNSIFFLARDILLFAIIGGVEGEVDSYNNKYISLKTILKSFSAFTLLELIVTIAILAILGTIGFISVNTYVGQARDSQRITDIDSIVKSIEIFRTKSGNYPDPTNGVNITFSGGVVWKQGTVGDDVMRKIGSLDKKPIDPSFSSEYTYSVTGNNREYMVGGIVESDVSYHPLPIIVEQVYAAAPLVQAYLKGNYNNLMAVANNGVDCPNIALPSIMLSQIPASGKLEDAGNNKLVFNKRKNIPASYSGKIQGDMYGDFAFDDYGTNSVALTVRKSCVTPKTLQDAMDIANGLKNTYKNSTLKNDANYSSLIQASDARTLVNIGVGLSNNVLGAKLEVKSNSVLPAISCLAASQTVNGHAYNVPVISDGNASSVTSSSYPIANGTITYTQAFLCTMGTLSVSGGETNNTLSCDSGYIVSGSTCIASCIPNCSGKTCGSDGCGGSCGTCGSGYSCSGGSCVSNCPNPCTIGTYSCQTGINTSWVIYCSSGCGYLFSTSCSTGSMCSVSGGGTSASCVVGASCTVGSTRCSGSSVETCTEIANGYKAWANPSYCTYGCVGGACKCDGCTPGQYRCATASMSERCNGTASCAVWQYNSGCASGCNAATGLCN